MKLKFLVLFSLLSSINSFASTNPEASALCQLISDNTQKRMCAVIIEDARFESSALLQCSRIPSGLGREINICLTNITNTSFDSKIYQVLYKIRQVGTLNMALVFASNQVYTDGEIESLMACSTERCILITLSQSGSPQ